MDIKDFCTKILSIHPKTDDAKRQWFYWFKSFNTYINKLDEVSVKDKPNLFINHVEATVYELIFGDTSL